MSPYDPEGSDDEPDTYKQMYGIDRKTFWLACAIGVIALVGAALEFFGDDIPALNKPAPPFVGILVLAVPVVLVAFALIRHYRRKR